MCRARLFTVLLLSVTKRRDGRSLDHRTLEELRRLGVARVLAGEAVADVARSLQLTGTSVYRWMEWYRKGGEAALMSTKATGRPRSLTDKQMARLKRTIIGKTPQQLNLGPALWTLPLVKHLIFKLFGIAFHKTSVARILHELGLTPQKPVRRAYRRDDEECAHWMSTEFPQIVRASKKRQSTLLFEDETGVHEDGPVGTTWAPRGETPVVGVTGTRRRINVISVVSPRGRLWFRCYHGRLNAALFIVFLQEVLRDIRGPIDMIVDQHPAHVAAAVERFVQKHADRLRLHFLPGYAPDLNPDEHVWTYVKGMFRRDPVHLGEHFDDAVEQSMLQVQSDRKLVQSFFGKPEVEYVRKALHW
jgi:transposase